MIVILFTTVSPSPLASDLSSAGGVIVYEALAISEVLALAQEHPEAQIVVSSEIGDERASVAQQHYPTLQLKAGATAADVVWELSHLFPLAKPI